MSRAPGTVRCPGCAEDIHPWADRCVLCGEPRTPDPIEVDVAVPGSRAVAALVLAAAGLALFLPALTVPGFVLGLGELAAAGLALFLPALTVPGFVLGLGELAAIRDGRSPRPGEPYALWAVFLSTVQLVALVLVVGWFL